MTRRFKFLLKGAALCVALSASPAAALEAPPDARFNHHFQKGVSLYSNEQYEQAIREFQIAFKLKERPRLLFNIGQAYRQLGRPREALRYYQLYQAMEPNPKPGLRAELEVHIHQMKELVSSAEQTKSTVSGDGVTSAATNAPGEGARSDGQPANARTPASGFDAQGPAVVLKPPTLKQDKPIYKRGWFWGVVGGAAATVLVTGVAGGVAANRPEPFRPGPEYPIRALSNGLTITFGGTIP
jgi:tetratricopeptide (TPR) repeat protein